MTTIKYDSWSLYYKKPFGAIQQGEDVRFAIDVNGNHILDVMLNIYKDGSELGEESYKMIAEEEGRYCYTYTVEQGKGLYFYYFAVKLKDSEGLEIIQYIGSSLFKGEGKLHSHLDKVVPFQLTCYERKEQAPTWYRESVFYQIFPDRFYNGNPNQQINAPKRHTFIYSNTSDTPMYIKGAQGDILRWDFYGGNLSGIRAKIPYLKELGINAIYLNPIFEAASNHRYDTGDYLKIDPMLGDELQFKQLVDDLQAEGIYMILDGVFSHVGRNSLYFNYDGSYGEGIGAYRNPDSPYYSWFTFLNYPEEYKSWWGVADLPEVDKTNESFKDFIYRAKNSVVDKWTKLGIKGWRLDVADELPDPFIAGIREKLDQYEEQVLIGEVWEDASNKISYDQRRQYILGNHLHGVMNYPLREVIIQLLRNERSPEELAGRLTKLKENYPRDVLYNSLNNIGTHDTERIFSVLGHDVQKLKLAISLLMVSPGIPCLYYGDEAGLTGGTDPDNRKFFPWHDIDQDLFNHCKEWIAERKENESLKYGDWDLFYTDELMGMIRYTENIYTIYICNPHQDRKMCEVNEITFLQKNPLPIQEITQILNNLTIAGKSDFFKSGTF